MSSAPIAHGLRHAPGSRRGGALVVALIVAVLAAAASAALLQLSTHYARRQMHGVHDQRAFYVAEAGLSEAYHALTIGQTGQIGSMEQPARSGEGFVWVDATQNPEDHTVRLESTAVVGLGRASLALVVERVEQPLGVFADRDLILDQPILVDGYDSETAPYVEQVGLLKIPVADILKRGTDAEGRTIIATEYGEFVVVEHAGDYVYVEPYLPSTTTDTSLVSDQPVDSTDPVLGTGWATDGDGTAPSTSDPATSDPLAPAPESVSLFDEPHTTGGGMIGSNGNITFSVAGAEIYGDVVPGPEGQVVLGSGTIVTGHTESRSEAVELPIVTLPQVEMLPAVEHGGATPMVIPPSTIGYVGLTVLSDAEVVVRGPSTVVIGAFELRDRSLLLVENLDGPVDLFVTQSANLALGSAIDVVSQDPSQLTLRVVGEAGPIELSSTTDFHGMIYGPEAGISLKAPFEVYGVLVGGTLQLGAGVKVHFDSGIAGDSGRLALPRLISWDVSEVPPEVRARINPYDLFDLDQESAPAAVDAGVTNSWTFSIRYHSVSAGDNKWYQYEGPYQDFDWSDVEDYGNSSFAPPETPFEEPWTIIARYIDFGGTEIDYAGPVVDYPIYDLERELERTLVPPPELAAQGVQPYYDTFIVP